MGWDAMGSVKTVKIRYKGNSSLYLFRKIPEIGVNKLAIERIINSF